MAVEALDAYAEDFCRQSDGRYRLERRIGAGNSAAVFEIRAGNEPFALKIYDPTFFQGDNAVVEKRRIEDQLKLRGHSHPNLVQLVDAGPIQDSWFLLMEYLPWASLADAIGGCTSEDIWTVIEGTAAAA